MLDLNRSSASNEIYDQHDQCNHQQKVDQRAGHVETPSKQPQNEQDRKNRPKHRSPLNTIKR